MSLCGSSVAHGLGLIEALVIFFVSPHPHTILIKLIQELSLIIILLILFSRQATSETVLADK